MDNESNSAMSTNDNAQKYKEQAHTYLKAELGMDDEQVAGILETLSSPMKETLQSVDAAYRNNNLGEIAETAHSLKGALLNLGLNELAELAKEIELSAASGKEIPYKENLSHLQDALQHI